jgi:hypothetical protein
MRVVIPGWKPDARRKLKIGSSTAPVVRDKREDIKAAGLPGVRPRPRNQLIRP